MKGLFTKNSKLNYSVKNIETMLEIILLVLFTSLSINAQTTSVKLPTTDTSSDFRVLDNSSATLLKLSGEGSFLSQGTFTSSTTAPSLGAGARMWWYPKKAAFRVGIASGTEWDGANVGDYSTAMGHFTKASGSSSTAMGYLTSATGNSSTAMGSNTSATGSYSTAMGSNTSATGNSSTAMGDYSTVNGSYSIATGLYADATGNYSTAMGYHPTASASSSTSIGYYTTASGSNSTALGNYVSTNSKSGSFMIGDFSTTTTMNASATNQIMMRFAGGYVFYTNLNTSLGVKLLTNATAWSTTSDSTKKENFLYADGEKFLNSISKMRLGSWNYKGQDPQIYRHYGPMAQDIYRYFGHDQFGIIGVDTLVNTLDMDGIEMIALQALEKRTDELRSVQQELKSKTEEIALLKQKVAEQQIHIELEQKQFVMQQKQIDELNKMQTKFAAFQKTITAFLEIKNKANVAMNK